MNLKLNFNNIEDFPQCEISVNNNTLYTGLVKKSYNFDLPDSDEVVLEIKHINKKQTDTVLDTNGNIVKDKSFELEKIIVDGYDFEHLIWKSIFESDNGETYESCLFFGPNGTFKINFTVPILKWILKHNAEDNNWQEDYEYYKKAIEILESIND